MACPKTISFAEVVEGRESSVRITEDGLFDVVDTVQAITSKDCNQANEALRNLKPLLFDKEGFVLREGRRYAAPRDIIALIMVLPGKMAKEIRCRFAAIIEDYVDKHGLGPVPPVTVVRPPHNTITKRQLERD